VRNALILHDVDVAPLQILSELFNIVGQFFHNDLVCFSRFQVLAK
jgi:hypothetical protein